MSGVCCDVCIRGVRGHAWHCFEQARVAEGMGAVALIVVNSEAGGRVFPMTGESEHLDEASDVSIPVVMVSTRHTRAGVGCLGLSWAVFDDEPWSPGPCD